MITREMLAEAMNEIDQDIIAEHIKRVSPPRVSVRYVVAGLIYAAACVAVVLALPFIIGKVNETPVTPNHSVSVTTDEIETTKPEEVKIYKSWDDAMEGEYKEALADLSRLCGYFHEPYSIGDNIMEKRILDICFRHALFYSFDYPSLVIDEYETQTVSISETELDSICKALFGEHVSIRDYDRLLYACPIDYMADKDHYTPNGEGESGIIGNSARNLCDGIYTFTYATDYWGECGYSINYDVPPVIKTNGERFSVTVELLYSSDIGESESAGAVVYTFTCVTDCSGKDRYRLVGIDSDIHCVNEEQCVITDAVVDFNRESITVLDGTNIFKMEIDENLISLDGEWRNYMSWNDENGSYVQNLGFVNAYRVDTEFVMDKTIIEKVGIGGFEGIDPVMGTNKNGVDYVMFFVYKSGGFTSYSYFRISSDIIVEFLYSGSDEDKNTVLRWCDSVSPMTQQ